MITERRFFKLVDLRSAGDWQASRSISGYAARFNSPSNPAALGFREQVMPGCFARAIREGQDCRCLINHQPSLLLGRIRNKSLSLREDSVGLRFRCELPDTTYARDLLDLMSRKTIDQCSFSFTAVKDRWYTGRDESGEPITCRDLEDADIQDVSVVAMPVYDSTSAWIDGDDDDAESDSMIPPGSGFDSFQLGRSLFPSGVPESFPAEVRSRIAAASLATSVNARRRALRDFILS